MISRSMTSKDFTFMLEGTENIAIEKTKDLNYNFCYNAMEDNHICFQY